MGFLSFHLTPFITLDVWAYPDQTKWTISTFSTRLLFTGTALLNLHVIISRGQRQSLQQPITRLRNCEGSVAAEPYPVDTEDFLLVGDVEMSNSKRSDSLHRVMQKMYELLEA